MCISIIYIYIIDNYKIHIHTSYTYNMCIINIQTHILYSFSIKDKNLFKSTKTLRNLFAIMINMFNVSNPLRI